MRRSLGMSIVVLSTLLLSTAAGAGAWDSYRDQFTTPSYNGSDGSLDWSPKSWVELNDDGKLATGAVHVDAEGNCVGSNCLHIFGEGVFLSGVGAQRRADTSVFSWFELCYEVRFDGGEGETEAVLRVEKSVNGGESWYTLKTHELDDGLQAHPTIGIGGPYELTIIRFTVDGFVEGEVFIDDVEIKGEPAGGSTTTTSTSTTSTSSTTTTTAPTTTTTTAPSTTTTVSETTSTTSSATTTTVVAEATTTTTPDTSEETDPSEESTSVVVVDPVDPSDGSGGGPDGSGIRSTPVGLQVVFNDDLFGQVGFVGTDFASISHDADFRVLAEVIEASWIWMVILGCLIGWAIVVGLDRRLVRSIKQKWPTPRWLSELSD